MNRLMCAFALLASASVLAQETDVKGELAKCAAVQSSLERLDCFDKLARSVGKASPPSPAAGSPAPIAPGPPAASDGSGKWTVKSSTNPVDDSKTVMLGLIEDGGRAMLILRCQQGKPEAYINWNNYLGSDAALVLLRVGEAKAETKRWSLSTDKKATFYPADNGAFIVQLASVDKLVAQVTPYSESPVTVVFDTRGLSTAMIPLKETCKIP